MRDDRTIATIKLTLGWVALLAVSAVFGFFAAFDSDTPAELIGAIRAAGTFGEQQSAYEHLIDRVGPREAQELLNASGLPFDGTTHLLNHTVGRYLYEHEGIAGITQCKEYFLASCYHGFIIDAVDHEGPPAIEHIIETCRESGEPVFAQCVHAIGHGLLAMRGYKKLPEALAACDAITTLPSERRFNCYDGVFMENVWGVHEGSPSEDRWARSNEPRYPCETPEIDSRYRAACWGNQPALLYQAYHGDIAKAAAICGELSSRIYQESCFDGLARQIHPLIEGNPAEAERLCRGMPLGWGDRCLSSIANAASSVGDTILPGALCARITGTEGKRCEEQFAR